MNNQIFTFYLVTAIGLESLAANELKEKWCLHFSQENLPSIKILSGGIELETTLERGCFLNHILKIPTRILLRLSSFKCRDFPKLYKKISKINWRPFLKGQIPIIKASSRKSRLINTSKVENSVIDGVNAFYKGNPPKQKLIDESKDIKNFSVYVRVDDDLCTVSIDTSGERLNIRSSSNKHIGVAPIRETLASALLYDLIANIKKEDSKNNTTETKKRLIDPMCGSGTFLVEASNFMNTSVDREFSFQHFPAYSSFESDLKEQTQNCFISSYIGNDIDSKVLEAAQINIKQNINQNNKCSILNEDLFSGDLLEKDDLNSYVIVNPPYGVRIRPEKSMENYFSKVICRCFEKFSAEMVTIIIPSKFSGDRLYKKLGDKFSVLNRLKFSNGGINVVAYTFKLNNK